jgi:hypothetical protein
MITLIATILKVNGICTSDELNKINDQIKPEIIFEEASQPI